VLPDQNKMTIQASLQQGVAEIALVLFHPMENGDRLDASDQRIAAHFIQWVQFSHNGQQVLEAQWGTGIASDPELVFYVTNAKAGDTVSVEWHDNKGYSGHHAITLS